ncbi:5'-flap endonuclease [Myotisia sp. PD_48]|nr:5'-flap endonuclease [Myotisia sp. PD_48]
MTGPAAAAFLAPTSASPILISSSPAASQSLSKFFIIPPPTPPAFKTFLDNSSGGGNHDDVDQPTGLTDRRLDTRVVLGRSPRSENLPIPSPKRRKITSTCDIGNEKMDASIFDVPSDPILPSTARESVTVAKPVKQKQKRKQAPKSQKSGGMINLQLKGRVTKASAPDPSISLKDESCQRTEDPGVSLDKDESDIDNLQLAPATKRRNSWTPIKSSDVIPVDLIDSPGAEEISPSRHKSQTFSSLLSDFNFSGSSHSGKDHIQLSLTGEPTRKQRLELISIDHGSERDGKVEILPAPAGRKRKPSKPRKLTTITAIATAQYEPVDITQDTAMVQDSHDNTEARLTGKGSKKRASKSKPKKSNRAKGLEITPQFKVAPVSEALKSLQDQAIIFGTASQLERDSSPEPTIRRSTDESKVLDPVTSNTPQSGSRSTVPGFGISRFSSSKSLWGAAARDLDGALAGIDVIDLLDSPAPSKMRKHAAKSIDIPVSTGLAKQTVQRETPPVATSQLDKVVSEHITGTSTLESVHMTLDRATTTPAPATTKTTTTTTTTRGRPISLDRGNTSTLPTSSKENPSNKSMEHVSTIPNPAKKPISKRTASQGLSNPSKASAPSPSRVINAADCNPEIPNPIMTTLRHKKPIEFIIPPNIIEIEESEDETMLTSCGQPLELPEISASTTVFPLEVPAQVVPGKPKPRAKSKQTKSEKVLQELSDVNEPITRAVRAQPRLRGIDGVKQPNWHERIVMYEPIPLDEFTSWLNLEGLQRVGEDLKVYGSVVRQWCESYRMSLSGTAIKSQRRSIYKTPVNPQNYTQAHPDNPQHRVQRQ